MTCVLLRVSLNSINRTYPRTYIIIVGRRLRFLQPPSPPRAAAPGPRPPEQAIAAAQPPLVGSRPPHAADSSRSCWCIKIWRPAVHLKWPTVCYSNVDVLSVRVYSVSAISAVCSSSTERPPLTMSATPSAVAAGSTHTWSVLHELAGTLILKPVRSVLD